MKYSKPIYWTSTILVLLIVGAGSFADLLQIEPVKESFKHISFPLYMLPFFGIAKLSACIAILIKSQNVLREWAYAGITFYFMGASYVHLVAGDTIDKIGIPVLILLLTGISYAFSKKLY